MEMALTLFLTLLCILFYIGCLTGFFFVICRMILYISCPFFNLCLLF